MHDEQLTRLIDKMLTYDEFKFLFGQRTEGSLLALKHTFDSTPFYRICNELGITIKGGASRIVIIPKNGDYVYKVNCSDVQSDYCEMEKNIYDSAAQVGLSFAFAATERVDSIPFNFSFPFVDILLEMANDMNGLSVTEAVENFDDEWDEYEGTLDFYRAIKIPEPFSCSSTEVSEFVQTSGRKSPLAERLVIAERFYQDYGAILYQKVSFFLEEHEVDDLHGGNVGILNNKLVLLDYCGYSD